MPFFVPVIIVAFCAILLFYLLQDDDSKDELNPERFLLELIQHKVTQNLTPDISSIIQDSYEYFRKYKTEEESLELTRSVPALLFRLMGESQEMTNFLSQEIDQLLIYNRHCSNREEFLKVLNTSITTTLFPEVREDVVSGKKGNRLFTITVSITFLALLIFTGFYLIQNSNDQLALTAKSSRPNFLLYVFLALFTIPGIMWIVLIRSKKN